MTISRRGLLVLASGLVSVSFAASAIAADYTMRIHTLAKPPQPYNDIAAALKADIEKNSDGRIEVMIFDRGQLGQEPAVIGEMAFGTIDMMVSTTSNAVQQVPELGNFTMGDPRRR